MDLIIYPKEIFDTSDIAKVRHKLINQPLIHNIMKDTSKVRQNIDFYFFKSQGLRLVTRKVK